MRDRELCHQRVKHRLAQVRRRLGDLENSPNILLDGEPAEDRGFLRQVADAETGPAIHRKIGDIAPIEADYSGIGADEPGYYIKTGRLSGAVWSQQPNHFAPLHGDMDIAQYRASLEALAQSSPQQTA